MGTLTGEVKAEEGACLPDEQPKTSLQNQIIATFICTLGTFSFGCSMGWLSPVIDDLQGLAIPSQELRMTEAELSWAGGLLCIGGLVGQPMFNYVAKKKGRKPSVYTSGLPIAISALMKIYATSSFWILLSQFLCGVGGAGALALPSLYVSETCEPRARGALSSFIMLQYSFGIFTSYTLGAFVSYEVLTGLQLAPPLVFMLGFWFMPETPLFRLKKGEEEAAARAVAWLRKLPLNSVAVRSELLSLARQLRGAEPLEPTYQPTKEDLAREMEWLLPRQPLHPGVTIRKGLKPGHMPHRDPPWKQLISSRAAMRGLIICVFIMVSQTIMGLAAISMYASVVFDAVHLKLSSDMCSIIYSIILMVGCGAGTLSMDSAGRRILQIGSCLAVAVGEAYLGVFFYMSTNEYAPDWMAYLALVAFALAIVTFNGGTANVIFVLLAEYFSAEVRDLANSIVMSVMWISAFILFQFFSPSVTMFGIANVFFFFAIVSFFSGVICFIFLPETKGKTLDEVLHLLETGIFYK